MRFEKLKTILSQFADEFDRVQVFRKAAALAFYTVLSLPGLLLVVIWISNIFYESGKPETALFQRLSEMIGKDSSLLLQDVLQRTRSGTNGYFAKIAGVLTLLFGASGVFVEIQQTMNRIWHLKLRIKKGRRFLKMLFDRVISFSMVAVLGFLLLVSLLVNTLVDVFLNRLMQWMPDASVVLVYASNILLSFLVVLALFSFIFRVLPDARIPWKDSRAGILAASVLFMGGQVAITFILSLNRLAGYYGPAGALLIILLWVFYSAVILYTGAIITRLSLLRKGKSIKPDTHARWKNRDSYFIKDPNTVDDSKSLKHPGSGRKK